MGQEKWHQTQEFLDLRKQWYQKLQKKGFHDIENIDWNTGNSGGEGGSRGLFRGGTASPVSQADFIQSYSPQKEEFWRVLSKWSWYPGCLKGARNRRRDLRVLRRICDGEQRGVVADSEGLSRRTVNRIIGKARNELLAHIKKKGPLG
jgi:hypothetical protein